MPAEKKITFVMPAEKKITFAKNYPSDMDQNENTVLAPASLDKRELKERSTYSILEYMGNEGNFA